MDEIKFGTDGWRGRMAEDYTFENVRYCAQGLATYLQESGHTRGPAIIAYDNRFQSEDFARAAAEVLAGNGLHALVTEAATPTPALSLAVRERRAVCGVIITASHNPAQDNGFKVRSSYGGATPPEDLKIIEGFIRNWQSQGEVRRKPLAEARNEGLIDLFDAGPAYAQALPKLVELEPIRRAGLKVAFDPMWGVGSGWFHRLIGGGATEIVVVNSGRNPLFPGMSRPEPISENLQGLFGLVRESGAEVGLATDGDADRAGFADERGEFINQLQAYALLALYLLEVRGWRGPIVKTISTTSMLDKLGRLYDVPVHEVGVGFKYVAPKMMETDALVGGEESGGYAYRGHVPERDGILSGLFFLDLVVQTGKRPTELREWLFSKVGPHFYDRIDTRIDASRREGIRRRLDEARPDQVAGLRVTATNRLDGWKWYLEDGGWLLIRMSGTEPLIRVYTETTDPARVRTLLEGGLELAGV